MQEILKESQYHFFGKKFHIQSSSSHSSDRDDDYYKIQNLVSDNDSDSSGEKETNIEMPNDKVEKFLLDIANLLFWW